jgi:hypothetical protein
MELFILIWFICGVYATYRFLGERFESYYGVRVVDVMTCLIICLMGPLGILAVSDICNKTLFKKKD